MLIRQGERGPIVFGDLRVFDYTAGQDVGASLALVRVPPKASHPRARSKRSDKHYLVVRGEIAFQIDDQDLHLSRGDYCFIRKGRLFGYSNEGDQPAELVLMHVPDFQSGDDEFFQGVDN